MSASAAEGVAMQLLHDTSPVDGSCPIPRLASMAGVLATSNEGESRLGVANRTIGLHSATLAAD